MNTGFVCTLPWPLEGNLFSLGSLSTRSTLQILDLSTEIWSICTTGLQGVRGWCMSCQKQKGELTALCWPFF